MFCAISGEVPTEPVVSKATGHLYEKRLIEKYLNETGKCPVSGSHLTESDLIPVQANKSVRPRPVTSTSIPGLLATFQNEWDELMLETFSLKQSLDTSRQELAQALYQHDAACRVIARLMRERDEARAALASVQAAGLIPAAQATARQAPAPAPAPAASTSMDVDTPAPPQALSSAVIDAINNKCKELSAPRKGRKPQPEGTLARQAIASLTSQTASFTPHSSDVLSLAISHDEAHVLTGGLDKDVLLSNRLTGAVDSTLRGHQDKVNSVQFHPTRSDVVVSASADKTSKVWRKSDGNWSVASSLKGHSGDVSAVAVHPTGDFAVTVSLDKSWAFWDLNRGSSLVNSVGSQSLLCGSIHPDGLILGTGTSTTEGASAVHIWDIRQQARVADFGDHNGSIRSLSFNENGYLMASGSEDGNVRIWDLRKMKNLKTFGVGGPIHSVAFDHSGLYLAANSSSDEAHHGVKVFVVKEWTPVLELDNIHTKAVSSVAWGKDSSFLCTASLDRVVRVFSSSE